MRFEVLRRACVALVSVSVISLGLQAPAVAGVVSTAEAVAAARGEGPRAVVDATLARSDVRSQLAELGVDAAAIEGRLAALSEEEIAALADQIESAPAGGDNDDVGAPDTITRRRHRIAAHSAAPRCASARSIGFPFQPSPCRMNLPVSFSPSKSTAPSPSCTATPTRSNAP